MVSAKPDWLCMPRFDSPSVFGSLLDTEKGVTSRSTLHYGTEVLDSSVLRMAQVGMILPTDPM